MYCCRGAQCAPLQQLPGLRLLFRDLDRNRDRLLVLLLFTAGVHACPADGLHAPGDAVEKEPHILDDVHRTPGRGLVINKADS